MPKKTNTWQDRKATRDAARKYQEKERKKNPGSLGALHKGLEASKQLSATLDYEEKATLAREKEKLKRKSFAAAGKKKK